MDDMSTESLIKTGVSEHIEQQQRNPNAISNGIDIQKAFDTDSRHLHSSGKENEDADKLVPSASQLHISSKAEKLHIEHEYVPARPEAGLGAESFPPPSHPNIEAVSHNDTKLGDDPKSGQEDSDKVDEDATVGRVEVGRKKKKKRKPKSQRGLVKFPSL